MEPGQELDALVMVEVFGWDLTPHEFGHDLPHGPFRAIGYDDEGRHVRGMPCPSTDIADAFELVDKHPYYFSLRRTNDYRNARWNLGDPIKWVCRFYAPEKFQVVADAAPHAICLAALKAVGYESA
jgi:hypothetical protein